MGDWEGVDVTKSAVLEALEGDLQALYGAFIFSETPQGFDFWDNDVRAGQLSDEARAILECLLLPDDFVAVDAAFMAEVRAFAEKMREGWANAIELGLIPPQHVERATVLRDDARALLAKMGME
jgi:hypothetical protein